MHPKSQRSKTRVYTLCRNGSGWICKVGANPTVGWGSRPDLAIGDWRKQSLKQGTRKVYK